MEESAEQLAEPVAAVVAAAAAAAAVVVVVVVVVVLGAGACRRGYNPAMELLISA